TGWRLDLNFGGAWYLAELDGDFPRLLIENVEIVTEDTNNNRCGIAGKGLLDALREKSLEREVHTDECCKSAPDLCFSSFRLVAAQGLEIDLEFAVVSAPRVFRFLGASDALRNGAHRLQPLERVGDVYADTHRLLD